MWKSMQFETQVALASSVVVATALLLWMRRNKEAVRDPELDATFLNYAMRNNIEGLRSLLPKKERVKDAVDADKNTALIYTLKSGFVQASKILIDEFGCDVTAVNTDGWSCFLSACFGGSMELVELVYNKANMPRIVNEPNFDGWTCLHIGAAKGLDDICRFGVEKKANVNAKNKAGHTPVLIAACNGNLDLVKYFVANKANITLKTEKLESPLFMAIRGREPRHTDIVNYIFSLPACDENLINSATLSGATPLHAAARMGETDIAEKLIARGADINAQERDGSTPLHAAIFHNQPNIVNLLISKNATINTKTRFGTTPLHEAAFYGRSEIARLLLASNADYTIRDNDGLTPLHITCTASTSNRGGAKGGDHVGVIRALLDQGADVNTKDGGQSTPLFIAGYAGEKGFELVPLLLERGADYISENWQGWNALHAARSALGHPATAEAIEAHARIHHPEFLTTFNKDKPRDLTRKAANPNLEIARAVFGDAGPSLEAIAERIKSGTSKKVVVLLGAGISVSAGIPDFRSPESGIYSQATAEKYKLSSPASAFDLGAIRKDPVPFYRIVKDIFYPVVTGAIKPTATHKFLKALKDHGVLSRIYTQNIDGLEYLAGLEDSDVVEAHGSFKTAFCMTCRKPANMKDFWASIGADKVPKCAHCGDTIRPGVTFFGEPLPSRFFETSMQDLRGCDLLIVMGTSLKVYPFASLVNDVSLTTPRLLFNKNEVGPFVGCRINKRNENEEEGEKVENSNKSPRDAAWIGECDEGVKSFAELLKWEL